MPRKLAKSTLTRFEKLFEQNRAEILKKVANNDLEVDTDGDDVDAVQAAQLLDLAGKVSSRELQRLKQIDAAMERIKAGSFGLCESCDSQIGEKRLIAMPQCTLCIKCQEEAEFTQKQFRQ
jgi:DnaK suppressor protein